MQPNTGPLQSSAGGPDPAGQGAPAIASQAAYALAALYLEAGLGSADVLALARLFDTLPHMATSIMAAMADLAGR